MIKQLGPLKKGQAVFSVWGESLLIISLMNVSMAVKTSKPQFFSHHL